MDVARRLDDVQTAVKATTSASRNLKPAELDMTDGISLLLLRPQLLMSSLHHLVILTAMRLAGAPDVPPEYPSLDDTTREIVDEAAAVRHLSGQLALDHEVFDKIRSLEGKLDYQIKKLVGLADATQQPAEVEEDPLSFRPNPSALLEAKPKSRQEPSGASTDVYQPPRMAAVSYEPERKRKERRAPALLSEFATTLDGAPVLESTSGLSVRPISKHTNSTSAKRAAELKRMDDFEEENMTRLVTTKREAKRRREDEEALALGYGVGGKGRSRRQNGLEAELEGVLGGNSSVWDSVSSKRASLLDRGSSGAAGASTRAPRKKARFEKAVRGRK